LSPVPDRRDVLVLRTTIPLAPDRVEEATDYVSDLVGHSREEPGTVHYEAARDLAEPHLLRFFEAYEDAAAVEAHTDSAPYRRFVEALPELADGEIETRQFETDDITVTEVSAAVAVSALD
jgi:quinol monooxygenase YgiN